MSRPDQSITFLSALGYSVVSLPSSDIKPGQTLLRTGKKDLTRLGDLATIMNMGSNPLPIPSMDNLAPTGVSGQQSSSVKFDIGVSILGNILKALAGTSLDVSLGFKNTKSVTFAYLDVLEDHIALDQLDQYLSTADIKPGQNTVRDAFIHDNIFVLTSTIKSQKITVTAQGDTGVSAKVDVPVIQNIASGKLGLDVSKSAQGQITFSGNKPVIFGFKAAEIFADDNATFTVVSPAKPGDQALRAAGMIVPTLLDLGGEGVFFRMVDPGKAAEAGN
jgi:hypothetical protein